MTNEIEKAGVFGNKVGMMNVDALKAAMAESAAKDPRGSAPDGADYMNFSGKRGAYEIGVEKRDTNKDELWVLNVAAFEDGWICWKDNRTIATRLAPLGTNVSPPDFEEHGPFTKQGEGWSQAKSLSAKSLDNNQQVYFKINSVSGVSVFAALQKEITDRLRAGQPYWPVVAFDREKFTAQGFQNFKPVITVDGWLSDEVMGELGAVFEDENAQIDLTEMYRRSMGLTAIGGEKTEPAPTNGTKQPSQIARRQRRTL